MKIGYMGIPGSFSEIAAMELLKKNQMEDAELIPLICAENILHALQNKEIDYGVLGVKNSSIGMVDEFLLSFSPIDYRMIDEYTLHVHQCLFKKNKDISVEELNAVASHPQAIGQTIVSRARRFPHLKYQYVDDTALAAEYLAKGQLPDTTAVICSSRAGEIWGLDLIAENIEDASDNETTFWLLKL